MAELLELPLVCTILSRKMLHLFEKDIDHKNQTARTKGEESCAPAHCTEKNIDARIRGQADGV
jgi:hypothetical protein